MYVRFPISFPSRFPLFPRFLFYSFRSSFNFALNNFVNSILPVLITNHSYGIHMIENGAVSKEGFLGTFELLLRSFF